VAREGVHVPPIAISSITNGCNLRCKGCHDHATRGDSPGALSGEEPREIVAEVDWPRI
jgi:pyruvate-formate lyase-activating enzyme